ncbi:protein of unknown function DUF1302 [Parvibaculum lavamentivorans DS-1]|uniref:DUF1302 domain-containing protein n=1 Tax=Parvibaculum lavamentivorans (strain DS-1 / DSM 13023 / NCIMB 13966) TaxID=402881 RepID=A7HSU8_PARL1|nr:protein of unknown function DUF1302 [Parvibaculum lavamentivorans DS-1]
MKIRTVQKLFLGSVAGAAMLFAAGAAHAVEFKFGEANLQIDNLVSVGAGFRTSKQDCTHVAKPNGGCSAGNGAGMGINDDDGNVNTDQWDPYTTSVKITTDFDLQWRNYGAFVRTKAFYDYWVNEELGTRNNRFGSRPITDPARGDQARDFGGRSFDLLDAFVYGNFDVSGMPLNVRVGKQVVNWGESLFIQGGINSFLPIDVTAIRTPGSELKEALMPTPSVFASIGLPGSVTVEAFWQFGWQKTELDACGTFFSTSDSACEGGAYVMLGDEYPGQVQIPRRASEEGDDTGTFGVAIKHYAENLGAGTDLGLYFTQQSLVVPIGTFSLGDFGAATASILGAPAPDIASFCGAFGAATLLGCAGTVIAPDGTTALEAGVGATAMTKNYLMQYPEDVQTFGASFNTSIPLFGGSAFSGEVAFTPDMPFSLSDVEINSAELDAIGACEFAGSPAGCLSQGSQNAGFAYAPGDAIRGYDEFDVITGQLATISTLNPSAALPSLIGSDLMILNANVGFQYLPDLSDSTNRLAAPRSANTHPDLATALILGDAACGAAAFDPAVPDCKLAYATSSSWGYRLAATADYNNAFGTAWTLTPSIQWAHDVNGVSAGPVGPGFVEGKKTISIGLNANLQNTWRANIQYTNSFGNEFRNFASDKDFVTATVSYAF